MPNLSLFSLQGFWKSEEEIYPEVTKLNNWPTIWFTPYLSKTWHIFISSKWLHQICPVFNFVRKKKHAWRMHGTHWWLQGAKSTLFMFGWQRVLSSAWHRQCAVVFGTSLHPSCPPDIHSPHLYWASVASCASVCMYAFARVWNYACMLCVSVYVFFELQLR